MVYKSNISNYIKYILLRKPTRREGFLVFGYLSPYYTYVYDPHYLDNIVYKIIKNN